MSKTMLPYVVRQGDYLAKLAFVHGFDADEVWQDAKNEDLRKLRPDPNILAPGDILYIPEKEEPEGIPIEKGAGNDYNAEVPAVGLLLEFKDGDGTPLGDEPCEVLGLGDDPAKKKTEGDGKLTLQIPVTLRELTVHFPQRNATYRIGVGDMDPEQEASGLQKRLQNLDFWRFHEEEDEDPEATLHWALRRFQEENGLEVTGAIDDATRKALTEQHGL